MKRQILLSVLLAMATLVQAQSVQWASKVVSKSSEYTPTQYGAKQALGPPNVFPNPNDNPCAWSPKAADSRVKEYIEVEFDQAIVVRQVIVAESFNAGCVTMVRLWQNDGDVGEVIVRNDGPTPEKSRWLSIKVAADPSPVKKITVYMNTSLVPGWNHIDAIGISDSEEPVEAKIHLAQGWDFEAKPENLGPAINSKYDEIMPIISTDGKTLYFDRKDHPGNTDGIVNDDIWFSTQGEDGTWAKAENVGTPLNNRGHNFLCSMSGDCKTVLLGNQYTPDGNMVSGLSKSQMTNGKWELPKPLNVKNWYNNNKYSEFSISPNCRFLLMTIQRNDGFGAKDLYVSFEEGDHYTEPLNLGPDVNTAATEMAPFLAADGKTLFFATDGRSGYGNKDIFITRRLDDSWKRWSEPENLGPIVNTANWDAYFTVPASGEYGYFSTEHNSLGKTDIFRVRLPESLRPGATLLLKGRIHELGSDQPLIGHVTCQARGSNKPPEVVDYDPANGDMSVVLPAGYIWELTAEAEGHAPKTEVIDLSSTLSHYTWSLTWQLQTR